MSESLVDIWNRQIEEAEKETVDKVFAGFPCKARRIPLRAMLKAGSLPQALVEHMLKMDNDEQYREQVLGTREAELYQKSLEYQQIVVGAVIAEPRFVFNGMEPGRGEVSYSRFVRLKPEFVDEVVEWVETGCPDVPVRLKGGEVTTVKDLAHFPDDGEGGKRPKSRTARKGQGRKRR